MRPVLFPSNVADHSWAYVVSRSYRDFGVDSGNGLSYLKDLGFRQLDHAMSFAFQSLSSTQSVVRVLLRCAEVQMVRVAARWRVACVKHLQAGCTRSAVRFPCKVMGVDMAMIDFRLTVSPTDARLHPNPASAFRDALDAIFNVLLLLGKHDTSTKVVGRYPHRGAAGPLRLFPVTAL